MKSVCVFCASSNDIPAHFFKLASKLGELMAKQGHQLVYGGAKVGLMNAVARSIQENGSKAIGVIPEFMDKHEKHDQLADELIITQSMNERKDVMFSRSDAFIVLPGGIGTFDEALEAMTLKKLQLHSKPIVFVNPENFFGKLFELFDEVVKQGFCAAGYDKLYSVASSPEDALAQI